jgi:hypothetical protein
LTESTFIKACLRVAREAPAGLDISVLVTGTVLMGDQGRTMDVDAREMKNLNARQMAYVYLGS